MNNIISFKANGNIGPSRFVKMDTTYDGRVTQAGTAEKIIGVSQEGSRRAPGTPWDDGYAAIAGEDLKVYCQGAECLLELGGTVAPGDRLKSDSSGKGVVTTTDQNEWGAIAMTAGVSGQLIKVRVDPFKQMSTS